MRKTLLFLSFFCSLSVFGQFKYSNEDLSVYKKIIHENSAKQKHIFELENGKIVTLMFYVNDKFRSKTKASYDKNQNLTQIDLIEFFAKDSITYESYPQVFINKYNSSNQLISVTEIIRTNSGKEKHYETTEFLNYNASGLPEKKVSSYSTEDLVYDIKGNIIQKTESRSVNAKDNPEIEITKYTYDKNNNVISIQRQNNYGRKYFDENDFSTYSLGGYPYYEYEEISYCYNKNGHWEKKYSIVKGKKTLREKRKFIK